MAERSRWSALSATPCLWAEFPFLNHTMTTSLCKEYSVWRRWWYIELDVQWKQKRETMVRYGTIHSKCVGDGSADVESWFLKGRERERKGVPRLECLFFVYRGVFASFSLSCLVLWVCALHIHVEFLRNGSTQADSVEHRTTHWSLCRTCVLWKHGCCKAYAWSGSFNAYTHTCTQSKHYMGYNSTSQVLLIGCVHLLLSNTFLLDMCQNSRRSGQLWRDHVETLLERCSCVITLQHDEYVNRSSYQGRTRYHVSSNASPCTIIVMPSSNTGFTCVSMRNRSSVHDHVISRCARLSDGTEVLQELESSSIACILVAICWKHTDLSTDVSDFKEFSYSDTSATQPSRRTVGSKYRTSTDREYPTSGCNVWASHDSPWCSHTRSDCQHPCQHDVSKHKMQSTTVGTDRELQMQQQQKQCQQLLIFYTRQRHTSSSSISSGGTRVAEAILSHSFCVDEQQCIPTWTSCNIPA